MHTLALLRRELNPTLGVAGIVMTLFDARLALAHQVVDEVRARFGEQLLTPLIPRNVRLSEAPSHGMPITLYDPTCRGAIAYRELSANLDARIQGKKTLAGAGVPSNGMTDDLAPAARRSGAAGSGAASRRCSAARPRQRPKVRRWSISIRARSRPTRSSRAASFDPEALPGARGLDPPPRPAPPDRRPARRRRLSPGRRRAPAAGRPARRRLDHPGDRPARGRVRTPVPRGGAHREPGPHRSQPDGGGGCVRAPRRTPSGSPTRRSRSASVAPDPGVSNAIRLLNLPAPVQEAVAESRLTAGARPRAARAAERLRSGGARRRRHRRRSQRSRDRAGRPGAPRTRTAHRRAPRGRRPSRSPLTPTTSRCGAASSRRSVSASASSAARAAAAGSSSTGPRTRTWTRSTRGWADPPL